MLPWSSESSNALSNSSSERRGSAHKSSQNRKDEIEQYTSLVYLY